MGVEYRPGPRLGELLLQRGVISADQLRVALTEQAANGERLGRILVRLGFVTATLMRATLAESLGQESADLAKLLPDPRALQLIPADSARNLGVFPLSFDVERSRLVLAMADTLDLGLLDRLRARIGRNIELRPLLADEAEILNAIESFYGYEQSLDGILAEIEAERGEATAQSGDRSEQGQPLVRLVNAILADAVRLRASDIHIEPENGFLRLRYRLDGVMRQVLSLHAGFTSSIAVRVKVMAGMDIAETRAPQDGRMKLSVGGRSIDFRVSTLRTAFGENLVIRVLDHDKAIVSLDRLGLPEPAIRTLESMIARPQGMLLVTGPTGSGKTTTLYSILSRLSTEAVNVMTLEDPVEYALPLVRQCSAGDSGRLSFARGIRHLMRQDPDIILVGEIRDEETAEMAFRAAMTGHQVFSTLHTTSAVGAISRLRDIGVRPETLAGNLVGVIGQRLLRRLCVHCRQPYLPDAKQRDRLGLTDAIDVVPIYTARGCPDCAQSGYRGRTAIVEILAFDEELDDLLSRGANINDIARAARDKGMRSLRQAGIERVLDGTTSLAELARIVDLERGI